MPLISTAAVNQVLNALDATGTPVNLIGYVQLHTASPGSTGANEMASVTRQPCAWNAAAAPNKTNSSALTFTTPGTNAASHFGGFSAASAGTYGIGGALGANVTAPTITVAAGALTISAS